MIYSPEYEAMMNVARTYAEAYKKFPAAKVQDKAAMKPDTPKGEMQARKMDKVRAVMTDNETGYGNMAREFNKRQPLENQKRGLEKKMKKPAVAGSEGAAKVQSAAVTGLQKKAAEKALDAKIKRPRTRMPKADRPGTIKKK